jgi:hypothetical protein
VAFPAKFVVVLGVDVDFLVQFRFEMLLNRNTRSSVILPIGASRMVNGFEEVFRFPFSAMKRPGGGSMTPEDIDPCLCTHVIYAFSEMDNNQLTPMEKHDLKDGNQPGYFERFNAWKSVNKNLKTLLAVGGWVRPRSYRIDGSVKPCITLGYGNERFRWHCQIGENHEEVR